MMALVGTSVRSSFLLVSVFCLNNVSGKNQTFAFTLTLVIVARKLECCNMKMIERLGEAKIVELQVVETARSQEYQLVFILPRPWQPKKHLNLFRGSISFTKIQS